VFSIGAGGVLAPVACDPATICKTGSSPSGVAIDPSGSHLYVSNHGSASVSVFSIGAGGVLAPVACDPATICKTGTSPDNFSLAVGPDRGPVAAFSASAGRAGSTSAFDATGSSSPDYPIASYAWDFGDGQTQATSAPTTPHRYAAPGSYTVTLTVTDQAGCSTTVVFTGQTASCNGSAKARTTQAVTVLPATFGANTLVTLKLAAKQIPARGPLKVTVSNANGFEVSGRLSGKTTKRVAVSRTRKRQIELKAKPFRVGAKAKKTVKLKLPKQLRRLLKRKGRLSLRLTAKVKDPAGRTRTVTKKVSPRLKKRPTPKR
jgi:hypothetical protein